MGSKYQAGQKYFKLTLLEPTERMTKNRTRYWRCQCECGKFVNVPPTKIKTGHTKSCGCIRVPPKPQKGNLSPIWKGHGEISGSVFRLILLNAAKRKIPFDISIKEMWELFIKQNRKCALTGENLVFAETQSARGQTASLDRIDSDGPYKLGNVQWVHVDINYMKQWFSPKVFLTWCEKVVRFHHINERSTQIYSARTRGRDRENRCHS